MAKRSYFSPVFLTVSTLADVSYTDSSNYTWGGTSSGSTIYQQIRAQYAGVIDDDDWNDMMQSLGWNADDINEENMDAFMAAIEQWLEQS